jgi:type II restriction enzyme
MLWRLANAIRENQPVNVDRVFAGSYNTRSVLETLLAYTPEYYFCYPGRNQTIAGITSVEFGHKHLIWLPSQPHKFATKSEHKTSVVISEGPSIDAYYDALVLPSDKTQSFDINAERRHVQMQIALIAIGVQLGFKTWIANNDKGITYQNKRLAELEGVVDKLNSLAQISNYPSAMQAAHQIDCVWFQNHRLIPAVIEIEHSTGVISGLARMKKLQIEIPGILSRYVIVAADDQREKVVKEANQEQFKSLNTRYFSYSAVEELYGLCQHRKLKGLTEEFLDTFMESVVV